MPRSKKNVKVTLSQTGKRGRQGKEQLVEKIHEALDEYKNVFVFTTNHMRNAKLKQVREDWKGSRFFLGKNKVMQIALGRTEELEYKTGLHHMSKLVTGTRGILFTNETKTKVLKYFAKYSETEFARSGNVATAEFVVKEGAQVHFSHAMEPHLRKLGLPSVLKKGVILIEKDTVVCNKGDVLTPEAAQILKLYQVQMAEFRIDILAHWTEKSFKILREE
eukprot:TRINITY_DN15_c1_g1_i1.p1 TRINITY_DN15_c1_g1~~TRINITY_DN15_c1_g1_i1.p1  ORF type:complete len:228 (+),score=83.70 TRINITY_DN15_c1_g1_i1:25-684(+)